MRWLRISTSVRWSGRIVSTRRALPLVLLGSVVLSGCERPQPPVPAPEVRGVVLDARSGAPISGAIVKRAFMRGGVSGFFDASAPSLIGESEIETTTDEQGRFVFPAESTERLAGMPWVVFGSDHMPARGCYSREDWADWSCVGYGGFTGRDPWVLHEIRNEADHVEFELRLWPPTIEGIEWPGPKEWRVNDATTGRRDLLQRLPEDVDPWSEYFDRLKELVLDEWLSGEVFVAEAERLVGTIPPSKGFVAAMRRLASLFSGATDEGLCTRAHLAWRLLDLYADVCAQHPDVYGCDPDYLGRERASLERRCPGSRR